MSLQTHGNMSYFAYRIYRLWCLWDNVGVYARNIGQQNMQNGYTGVTRNAPGGQQAPAGPPPPGLQPNRPGNLRTQRQALFTSAFNAATGFLPNLTLRPAALRMGARITWGKFVRSAWEVQVNMMIWNAPTMNYGLFLEFASTLYHEARHAEQTFRIAQGLASNQLTFPRRIGDGVLNRMVQANGVQALRNRFQLVGGTGQGAMTPGLLSAMMDVPLNVTQAAQNNAVAAYTAYLNLAKPAWFKQRRVRDEVDLWMRSDYTDTGVYLGYAMHPLEQDAFGTEAALKRIIEGMIGVPSAGNANLQRNDPRFAHLPNT